MAELWEDMGNAIASIKDFVFGFVDIAKTVIGFIPSPFKEILLVAVLIIVAITARKVLKG